MNSKTATHQKTQTEVLANIHRLYQAGCLKLSGANEMDRAIFETNLTEAIAMKEDAPLITAVRKGGGL